MNLVRNRVVIVVVLSIVSFTATASVLSGLQHGVEAFSADSTLVISSPDAPTVFSSRIDAGILSALNSTIQQFTGDFWMSPEIFAFCSFGDEGFVVRGVNYSLFNSAGPEFKQFEVLGETSEHERSSAMIGHRLLQRLGVELPCTMPLVGSYSSRMDLVSVVGWFETSTSMDDEMFVNLERARFLSGMPADKLSIIRVSSEDPDALREVLTPEQASFTLFDFHSSKSEVAVGENFTVEVDVRNWGQSPGQTTVSFSVSGQAGSPGGSIVLGTAVTSLNASSSKKVSQQFSLESLGEYTMNASIAGSLPTSLGLTITVITPYIRYWGPSTVMLDSQFNVTVLSYDGSPVPDAQVSFLGDTSYTDDDGLVALVASSLGDHDVTASVPGMSGFTETIEVLDPLSFPDEFSPSVLGFELTPDSVRESQQVKGIVQLTNEGRVGGSFDLEVYIDDGLLVYNVSLSPLENKQFTVVLDDLSVGTHTAHVGTFSDEVVVEPWYASEPDFVELLIRYGGNMQITSSASIPVYQAAKISQGNVELALFSIGAVAALLASLCITAVFSKEVHESRRRLGIIKTIGARRGDVIKLVTVQALARGLVGASFGVLLGVLISGQLSESGMFMIFGHELAIEWDSQLVSVILLAAVAISVTSALTSALIAVRETAVSSIRGIPEDKGPAHPGLESISDGHCG